MINIEKYNLKVVMRKHFWPPYFCYLINHGSSSYQLVFIMFMIDQVQEISSGQ